MQQRRYTNAEHKALLKNTPSLQGHGKDGERKKRRFWPKYEAYDKSLIYYADETGVYFDMLLWKALAEVGKSSKVDTKNKHSERISVVLTVRADGLKLPLLFIIKGQPGGLFEKKELPTYDPTHVYPVQANAWMVERVWNIYLERLFAHHVEDASVLLVDNLDCHVSETSYDKTARQCSA
ncbi:hypothetical protein AaE_014423 [Aphanomyces astaci]|uniref:DDE-1 domain-containing protein n=1 Tax=Aphanomyces astaci TaxID=112090 RepID=A0A6A4Z3K9_APHAT|nr:hypothetical protein AaE_014423 [Aphanomyces astaci]